MEQAKLRFPIVGSFMSYVHLAQPERKRYNRDIGGGLGE